MKCLELSLESVCEGQGSCRGSTEVKKRLELGVGYQLDSSGERVKASERAARPNEEVRKKRLELGLGISLTAGGGCR